MEKNKRFIPKRTKILIPKEDLYRDLNEIYDYLENGRVKTAKYQLEILMNQISNLY